MKFTIQQKALEEALAVTILATEAKSPHDMYSRLLIDARPDGEVHFYDDIYGHDPKLTAALAKANP